MTEEEILHQDQEVVPFKLETIKDDENWSRYAYELSDGTKIIAKSVEEMPNLTLEGNTFILTPEEKPNSMQPGDYDAWVRTSTSNHIEESRNIIVNNTPLGALDLALFLVKKGEANDVKIKDLVELRDKVAKDIIDEQVLSYYDSFVEAGFKPSNRPEYHHDGLMLLAMSLTGDENSIIELRTRHNDFMEYVEESKNQRLERSEKRDLELDPGTKLSQEQLDMIANEHLVAVHTSFTETNDEGDINLLTSSVHDRMSIRPTIHWSLNHAVISHLYGNFDKRSTTIVSRLESLARDNGSPAVLYGVDTYFTLNPKESLGISKNPEESVIISFKSGEDLPVYQYKQNNLVINPDKLYGEDLLKIFEGISSDNFNARSIAEYKIFRDNDYKSQSEIKPYDGPLLKLIKEKISDGLDIRKSISEIIDSLIDGTIKLEDYPSFIYEETERSLSYRVPSLNEEIQEIIRLTTVDSLITKYKGEIVRSDNQSAYIETEGFDNRVIELANKLGIRVGLHTYQPESSLESDAYERNSRSTYSLTLEAPIQARRNRARKGLPVQRVYTPSESDRDLW